MFVIKQKNPLKDNSLIENEDFDEFLYQPTPLSTYFKDQIKLLYQTKTSALKNNYLRKLVLQFNLLIYIKLSHSTAFDKLKQIDQQLDVSTTDFSLEELMTYFLKVQEILMNNNLALSVFYLKNKVKIAKKVFRIPITFEEQSKFYLQMIQDKPFYLKKFRSSFAHYSMNNYELAARRFSEYSDTELLKLSKLVKNLKLRSLRINSTVSEQFVINPLTNQDIYWNLLIIRDVAKDISIKIVALLRRKILIIAKTKHIANPFQLKWHQLLKCAK